MSEDDDSVEPCPLCKHKECEKHVLACFDRAGDDGAFGLGLLGGALCHVNEIDVAMEHARLAWVRSVRATGKPKAPQWIMKDFGLQQYFDALGRSVSGGKVDFDVGKYKSDEDAADDLQADTDQELWHAREDFLWEDLSKCGSFETTEEETVLTTLVIWWAWEPRAIVKRFRAKLQRILLEAGVKVKPKHTKAKTAGATKSNFKRPSMHKSTRRRQQTG